jgi:hypothetical protein
MRSAIAGLAVLLVMGGVTALGVVEAETCYEKVQNELSKCLQDNPADPTYCNNLANQAFQKCPPAHYVWVTISGLAGAGGPVVLQDEPGSTALSLFYDGTWVFQPALDERTPYNIMINSVPPALMCSLQNGSGVIGKSDATGAVVRCSCPATSLEYQSCTPALDSASANGEDAHLGYDINAATGNLFLTQPDIHVHPPLGPDLNFVRYYNSHGNRVNRGLGPKWTHTYSWAIKFIGNQAVIVADTGAIISFTFDQQQSKWVAQPGEFSSLIGSAGSVSAYTTKYGTRYAFDSAGRLTSIQPADNIPITVSYSRGSQISAVSSGGLSLVFSYEGPYITKITDLLVLDGFTDTVP